MIKKLFVSMAIVLSTLVGMAGQASALDVFPACSADPGSTICTATSDKLFGPNSIWTRILDTFTYIIGGVSVLVIIIGGIRYVTSGGEQAGITAAKNTILYAVVGLVIAILAYSIVHFVISAI